MQIAAISAPRASPRILVGVAAPYDPSRFGAPMQVTGLTVGAGGSTGDDLADSALRTASIVDDALEKRFGRHGIDGKGGTIQLVVHAPDRANAYWDKDAQRIELGDGDGVEWGAFGSSVSVMAHELYHGVIDAEVALDYEQPEQAAIHESLADVFAAGVSASWRIGEDVKTPGVSGDAIRDLAHPDVAHVDDARRAGGEAHVLSGVASLAAVRVADKIGSDAMQDVWYRALVDDLPDGAGFAATAAATIAAASRLHGADSRESQAVRQAWESVGVLAA